MKSNVIFDNLPTDHTTSGLNVYLLFHKKKKTKVTLQLLMHCNICIKNIHTSCHHAKKKHSRCSRTYILRLINDSKNTNKCAPFNVSALLLHPHVKIQFTFIYFFVNIQINQSNQETVSRTQN